jgi:chorismate synthase
VIAHIGEEGSMFRFLITSLAMLLALESSIASAGSEVAIQIPRNVPYASEATVAENVRNECTDLGTRLATSLQQFAAKHGVATVVVDEIDPKASGAVFQVEIVNVFSAGNAFIGHRKSMEARGELFVNGVSRGQVDFTRNSGGGFGAGFKGSCSVLARCSKTLGNDFAKWLKEQQ